VLLAPQQPREHPSDVRVQHDRAATERERPHRRGRVLPDPRQGPQVRVVLGDPPVVPLHHGDCRRMQVERAPRVAQPIPLPHGRTRRIRREVGG